MEGVGNTLIILAFALLLAATVVARLGLIPQDPEPYIEPDFKGHTGSETLFVYIPGLDRGKNWPDMRSELYAHGDTLNLSYPHPLWSNADPLRVAGVLAGAIEKRFQNGGYSRVVLIGQSMGALLAKRTFLEGEESNHDWSREVSRVVLLAGMNRGWDISGQKPSDMGFFRRFTIWAGSWAGRVVGFGKLILSAETGSPFVANLRVDWLKRMRSETQRTIEVVQLLGDIDDLVSEEDNKDLQAIAKRPFAWVKVRGTGHGNIADFNDDTQAGNLLLGEYRRQKFELATIKPFSEVEFQNEVQPFQPETDVTHLVFVVHGIRDLGEWAAAFEQELRQQFRADRGPNSTAKLAVASIRYGYFGMGPFLLRPVRQKYVKWFMDEYTEALALYPEAREVHFVGHSNGTYLLAAALEQYDSLHVGRVVFGGSVVRRDYNWKPRLAQRLDLEEALPEAGGPRPEEEAAAGASDSARAGKGGSVLAVRNYMAIDDWVVALFPRFFEPSPVAALLGNDIGSAGFNGFKQANVAARVIDIPGLTGGHGAFLSRIEEVADFVLRGADAADAAGPDRADSWVSAFLSRISRWGADWGAWFFVWPFLAAVILFVGWHVTTAAPEPRWPIVLAYATLVLLILRKV